MSERNTSMINPIVPCNECQAGHMHRQYVAYYTWLGDELITVPDFPAWVCDFCGRCEYDENALTRLTLLLSPNAGKDLSANFKVRKKESVRTKLQRPTRSE